MRDFASRLCAALSAVLLVLAPLASVLHFVFVPHAFCAEHGDLIDLHERPTEIHAAEHASDSGHAGAETSQNAAGSEHDHCQFAATERREVALPTAVAVELIPALESTLLPLVSVASEFSPQPLLSLAPKTSPPTGLDIVSLPS